MADQYEMPKRMPTPGLPQPPDDRDQQVEPMPDLPAPERVEDTVSTPELPSTGDGGDTPAWATEILQEIRQLRQDMGERPSASPPDYSDSVDTESPVAPTGDDEDRSEGGPSIRVMLQQIITNQEMAKDNSALAKPAVWS